MEVNSFIGKTFSTREYGDYVVLREIIKPISFDINNRFRKYYEIEFLATKYRTVVRSDAIGKNNIRDPFVPKVINIGYYGSLKLTVRDNIYIKSLYKTWVNMLNRCYNPNDISYKYYGARGITVDPRWYNFTNFYNDARQLANYELKMKYPNEFKLDKDYLQMNIPYSKRVYSKDTCIWLSNIDNLSLANMNNSNKNNYHGVYRVDGLEGSFYYTKFENIAVASFKTAEAAACYYNYLCIARQEQNPYCNIPATINNIEMIPLEELLSNKYLISIINETQYKIIK